MLAEKPYWQAINQGSKQIRVRKSRNLLRQMCGDGRSILSLEKKPKKYFIYEDIALQIKLGEAETVADSIKVIEILIKKV